MAIAKKTGTKVTKTPRQRFQTVGVRRVNRAIKALRALAAIGAKTYEFTPDEAKKIMDRMSTEYDAMEQRINPTKAAKTTDDFSL